MKLSVIQLVTIYIILIIINLVFIFIFLPPLLDLLGNRIKKFRNFIKENEGFFSVCFVCLFALEQAILIILTSLPQFTKSLNRLRLIIGLFALIVITTAAFQKFILEKQKEYKKRLLERSNEVIVELKALNKYLLEKLLKKSKSK